MKKLIATFALTLFFCVSSAYAETINLWFAPGWKSKAVQAKEIASNISTSSGLDIKPRIARSYPEILTEFSSGKAALVYVGSFVQAIINARGLGTPLVQAITGKEFYSGILIYPTGEDPASILKNHPRKIAYAIGASSGESSAKAATAGLARMGVANHGAAANAVKARKAKAAVVKNWWWEANKDKYRGVLESYRMPGITIEKNSDNVLTASKGISVADAKKITASTIAAKDKFKAKDMVPFDEKNIAFSLELMKKGGIDPQNYTW